MRDFTRRISLFAIGAAIALTAARIDAQSEANAWTSLGLENEDGEPLDARGIAASRTPPTRLHATGDGSIFVSTSIASPPGSPPTWNRYTHVPDPSKESPFYAPQGVVVDPNDPLQAYVVAGTRFVPIDEGVPDLDYPSGGWGCMLGRRVWTAPAGGTLYVAGFAPIGTSVCPELPGYGCELFRSTDDGAHWTCVDVFFNVGANDLAVDPLDSDRVFAAVGLGTLAKSVDGAASWEILDGAPEVSRLAIDPFTPSVLWLATTNGELWRSDDGGAAFELVAGTEQGLPEVAVVDLLAHRVDPNILYLAYAEDGVFATIDGGATFRKLDVGLPAETTVYELALDPAEPSRLYAATSSGVYTLLHEEPRPCVADQRTLCLLDGRFELRSRWRDFRARPGFGTAVSLSSDSGYFWFFDEDNLELVAKTLDGNAFNDRFWLFYGALSNVEFELVATDTETGEVRGYFNPSRTFASRGDTEAFPRGPRSVQQSVPLTPIAPDRSTTTDTACAPDALTLCLGDGRFRVRASWQDFKARVGAGHAAPLNETTGTFWFFHEENTELAIKILDGRAINDHFWVFYGALSNVEYTLTVDDLDTGESRVYFNPLHQFASRGDTEAFAE
jgi:hypothetical protein